MKTSAERLAQLAEMELCTERSPWRRAQSGQLSEPHLRYTQSGRLS